MANDKGSKRLIMTYLGSFTSEAQNDGPSSRALSARVHALSSLATIPSMNSSARIIRISGGFTLFQNPVLRERNSLKLPRFPLAATAVKVFY